MVPRRTPSAVSVSVRLAEARGRYHEATLAREAAMRDTDAAIAQLREAENAADTGDSQHTLAPDVDFRSGDNDWQWNPRLLRFEPPPAPQPAPRSPTFTEVMDMTNDDEDCKSVGGTDSGSDSGGDSGGDSSGGPPSPSPTAALEVELFGSPTSSSQRRGRGALATLPVVETQTQPDGQYESQSQCQQRMEEVD